MICSECCGEHRGRAISCVLGCSYLVDHEAYQRERLGIRFVQERQQLYRELERCGGQKTIEFLHFCDVTAYQFFYSRPETLDWELLVGFEDLRRRLSPISLQHPGPTPYGEHLGQEVQGFCKQAHISPEMATEAVDHILRFFKGFSGNDPRSNRYWKGLLGFIDHFNPSLAAQMKNKSEEGGKIILPSTRGGTSSG
jgi:hypothetical protein